MHKVIRMIINKVGIDLNVGYTMMYRISSILCGALLIILIPIYFSTEEQGFYYTFSSLIALQIFFELGFNFVVTQIVSHEMPYVLVTREGVMSGDIAHVSRLKSLFRFILKWYGLTSFLFFIVVAPAGYFFIKKNDSILSGDWPSAWFLLAFFSSLSLFFSPVLAFFEGMGRVGDVAKLRLTQTIISLSAIIIALNLKFGLFIAPLGVAFSTLVLLIWLYQNKQWMFSLVEGECKNSIRWAREIFPFQYRIAISWASGYFIFQLYVPMVFLYRGVEEAGRVGFAISVFSGISTFSLSWINANLPKMAGMVAAKVDRCVLNAFFKKLLLKSSMTFLVVWVGVVFVRVYAATFNISISAKLPTLKLLIVLGAIFFVQQVIGGLAIYVRSHKEEPFMINAVVTGVFIFCSLYAGLHYSLLSGLCLCFLSVLISLVWVWTIFKSYYQ